MILQYVRGLNKRKIILASASPRRLEILNNIGLSVEVVVSSFEENLSKEGITAGAYAEATASHKAQDIASKHSDAALIIAADTVVDCMGEVLEKARNEDHAREMLVSLSGKEHQVHTGVALIVSQPNGKALTRSFHETTRVTFGTLSAAEIDAYLATGEFIGKAGSYGIQGPAGAWITRLEGCYFNVMGFPVHRFAATVEEMIAGGQLEATTAAPG